MFFGIKNKIDWNEMSERKDLSYKEIYKYRRYLDFTRICRNYPRLTLEFIHDLRRYIDWKALLIYHDKMPEVFILMHEYKYIDFVELSKDESIPYEILERYEKFFDWQLVTKYRKFGTKRAERYYKYLDKPTLLTFQKLDSKFLEAHWSDLKQHAGIVESCQKLSVKFMRDHADELNWHAICLKQSLSSSFMEEMSSRFDAVCWNNISERQKMTENFIRKHERDLNMEFIVSRDDIKVPDGLVMKYKRRK